MLTIVNNANKKVQTSIGGQIYKNGVNYIKSPYLKEVKCDDGLLVYNSLTSEIILIDENDYNAPTKQDLNWLKSHWYYIDEKTHPRTLADMFRQIAFVDSYANKSNKSNSYVIMTTTACNARCFYCYECGYQQKPMTDEIAKKVAKFLVQNCKQHLHLTWFGGEPLCNINAIRIISEYLNEQGINYDASMISNGYLFNTIEIDEIKNNWKFKNVQITIDGTKEIYQAVKNYRNNDENAYERIFENIKYLLDNDIAVSIRMNVGLHNGEDILKLIRELANNFLKYPKFHAYAVPLFIGEGDPPLILTDEEADKLYTNVKSACSLLKDLNFSQKNFNINVDDYKPFHCMADSEGAKMITVEGNLTPCEHHAYTEICGDIYEGVTNWDIISSWKERLEVPECETCFNYPKCVKIKKCATDNICEKPQRMLMDYHIEIRILEIYEDFLRRREKKENMYD